MLSRDGAGKAGVDNSDDKDNTVAEFTHLVVTIAMT